MIRPSFEAIKELINKIKAKINQCSRYFNLSKTFDNTYKVGNLKISELIRIILRSADGIYALLCNYSNRIYTVLKEALINIINKNSQVKGILNLSLLSFLILEVANYLAEHGLFIEYDVLINLAAVYLVVESNKKLQRILINMITSFTSYVKGEINIFINEVKHTASVIAEDIKHLFNLINNRIQKLLHTNKQFKGLVYLVYTTVIVISILSFFRYFDRNDNNLYATPSYTVKYEGRTLFKVRDRSLVDSMLKQIEKDLEKNLATDIALEANFEIVESNARDKEIASEEKIYKTLQSNISYGIYAYAIKIDGTLFGIVKSKQDANNIIESVKKHFTQNYNSDSIIDISLAEKVTVEKVETRTNELKNADEIIDYIIKGSVEAKTYKIKSGDSYWKIAEKFNMSLDKLMSMNPTAGKVLSIGQELNLVLPKPYLNVVVKRKVIQEEKTPYKTDYKYVSYLYNDEEIVEKNGKYGVSTIESIVTEQNGVVIAKEIISEKVISNPVTKLVTSGTKEPPAKKGTGYFINPLPAGYVSSRFGSRWGGYHLGLDLAANTGASIKAADGGVVTFAGWAGSYGYCVDIDHGGGFTTRYGHCSQMYVKAGDKVYQGKTIAAVGSTGKSTGPHLHFEVRKYGAVVNPQSYIEKQYR